MVAGDFAETLCIMVVALILWWTGFWARDWIWVLEEIVYFGSVLFGHVWAYSI